MKRDQICVTVALLAAVVLAALSGGEFVQVPSYRVIEVPVTRTTLSPTVDSEFHTSYLKIVEVHGSQTIRIRAEVRTYREEHGVRVTTSWRYLVLPWFSTRTTILAVVPVWRTYLTPVQEVAMTLVTVTRNMQAGVSAQRGIAQSILLGISLGLMVSVPVSFYRHRRLIR